MAEAQAAQAAKSVVAEGETPTVNTETKAGVENKTMPGLFDKPAEPAAPAEDKPTEEAKPAEEKPA